MPILSDQIIRCVSPAKTQSLYAPVLIPKVSRCFFGINAEFSPTAAITLAAAQHVAWEKHLDSNKFIQNFETVDLRANSHTLAENASTTTHRSPEYETYFEKVASKHQIATVYLPTQQFLELIADILPREAIL